jgi:hypothetical protein
MAQNTDMARVDPADRVSWSSRLLAGIADGILSAVLMMGFMMAYSSATGAGVTMPLKALGALVYGVEALVAGSTAMLAGAGIQLGFSIVLGILFALCTSRRTSIVAEMVVGIADRVDAAGIFHRTHAVRYRSRADASLRAGL